MYGSTQTHTHIRTIAQARVLLIKHAQTELLRRCASQTQFFSLPSGYIARWFGWSLGAFLFFLARLTLLFHENT